MLVVGASRFWQENSEHVNTLCKDPVAKGITAYLRNREEPVPGRARGRAVGDAKPKRCPITSSSLGTQCIYPLLHSCLMCIFNISVEFWLDLKFWCAWTKSTLAWIHIMVSSVRQDNQQLKVRAPEKYVSLSVYHIHLQSWAILMSDGDSAENLK